MNARLPLAPNPTVSVIVPTIGRPGSLKELLSSLRAQTRAPLEVIVADASGGNEVAAVLEACSATAPAFSIKRLQVEPPSAVRQRIAAIRASSGEMLLLLDDDVVLEADCIEEMIRAFGSEERVVGVFADLINQDWPAPTTAWRIFLRLCFGVRDGEWQGAVVGPLMRFAFVPRPTRNMPMKWIGAGNSMIRRASYEECGGFSNFFLHRSSINEDVDLGIKLARIGTILFCPAARMSHFHAPSGRVSVGMASEDDVFNRFNVLVHTVGDPLWLAFSKVATYCAVESASNLVGSARRRRLADFVPRTKGRVKALLRIIVGV